MSGAAAHVTLVVPCFNEARRLDRDAFLRGLCANAALRLHFVDDGSSDATPARLAEIASARPDRIAVQTLPANRGKGEAVRLGLRAALRDAPRYVGYWDADLSTPLAFAETLAQHLDAHPEVWLAAGSRVLMLGRPIARRAVRHYLGRVAATLVSGLLRAPVYDSQCGAKLLRNTPELPALLEAPFLTRWLFDVELLARIARTAAASAEATLHRRVHEVPVPGWSDVPGSKIRPRDLLRLPADLWRIRRGYR